MSVNVRFKIGQKKGITANYNVSNEEPIKTIFRINAPSAAFSSITGSPYDNANLKAALDAKADKSELDADVEIINQTINENYNTLDSKIDDVNSDLSGDISTLETSIQNEATTRAENDTLLQEDINTLRNDLTSEISNRTTADNTLQGNIDNIQNTINNYGDIVSYDASDFATYAQGQKADSALQPNDNISELVNNIGYITSASLPTVNNGTLTIQANSTTVGTFTANQSGDTIANITIPTDTADLTNGANFVNTTDLATKVSKSGDTMTGDLEINKSIYLTSVAATAANSASKLYFGPKSSPYNYMAANTSGVFGIYNSSGKGIGCYPTQNLFPTNNIDLGRSNNKWKDIYASGKLYGASTNISITNLISGATLGATAIQPNDNVSSLTNDAGYITSASLPTVNDATITIQKNGTDVNSFTLNQASDDTINITVPTTAADVGALPDTTTINDLTTAEQQAALNSGATTTNIGQIATNTGDISTINGKIPAQASSSNQLADKNFVNSSVQTATANFRGNWNDWAAVPSVASDYPEDYAGNKTPTVNDYLVVQDASDYTQDTLEGTWRFKYTGDWSTDGKSGWIPEYQVNETPLTAAQLAALNSGITANDVTLIGTALQPNDNISELTNNAGYITGITSSDVTAALGYTPYNSTNPDGYITASDLPTNYVTTDTAQDISGRKTFLGEKAIYFKQNAATDKLGFTLYNASSSELAALEYRPNTINGASLLALNCPQTTGGYVGFRYWGTPAVNIVAPKVATAGNYFIPTHITNGTLTVTANTTGTIDISTLLPDVSNFVTNSSLSTTLADYVLSSSLATVATTGAYSDLTGTPTIPSKTSDLTNDSGFITSSALSSYQPLLVSGTNIKTVNNTSLLGSGNIDTSEIFIAEYGTTTFTEVLTAYNASKVVFCYDDNNNTYAPITNYTGTDFYFSTGLINNISASYTLDNNDSWDGGTTTLATVATSGSYNDLSNKPTIPTVPTNISAFTNDAGYITGINSSDVTTALGYTPYNSTNPDGFITSSALAPYALSSSLATVATSGSYTDLSNKPTIPPVNDATITFTQGGTTKGTITLNQSSDATIALDAGGSSTSIPNPAYGTSSTAAATAQKEVSIPEITALNVGQVIMIRPSTTSTVANSTIKLNNFDAHPMRYNNAAITTSTDSTVWGANFISSFMFDGTYWQFIGHGIDSNTTYSNMSVSEGTTGTATSARTMRADYLKQIIQGTKLTGLDTSDNSAVTASDTVLSSIGKLQAEINNTISADTVNYLLSDREDAFDIQSPLTMTYTLNGDGSLQNGITMNPDGTLTTGNPDLYFGFDKGFGTAIPQTAYWEFNFKFKRISTSSTAVPFFAVDDVDTNFIELYLQDYNIPQDTWIYCNVLHKEGASNVEFRYTVNDVETFVNNVLISGYTLSSNKYVNLIGLGISEVFSLDWETYYRYSPDDRRNVFTDRTLGAESEIFVAEYNVTPFADIKTAYDAGKTILCKGNGYQSNAIGVMYRYSYALAQGGIGNCTFYSMLDTVAFMAKVSLASGTTTWETTFSEFSKYDLSNVTSIASGSAVQTALDTKVNKSGDTMTGELNFDTDDNNRIAQSIGNVSTSAERDMQFFATTAGHRVGVIRGSMSSDGTACTMLLGASNPNNSPPVGFSVTRTNSNVSCAFPDTTCVDGQWDFSSPQTIISTAVSLNGSTDLSYTVTLPNDGHIYEVMIRADANTGNATGNWFIVGIKSNVLTNNYIFVCGTATQAARAAGSQGTVIIPMKYGTNNLTLRRNTNYTGSTQLFSLGYRRVGTNS